MTRITPLIKRFIAAWAEGSFDAESWEQMTYAEQAYAELEMHHAERTHRAHGRRIARQEVGA